MTCFRHAVILVVHRVESIPFSVKKVFYASIDPKEPMVVSTTGTRCGGSRTPSVCPCLTHTGSAKEITVHTCHNSPARSPAASWIGNGSDAFSGCGWISGRRMGADDVG